MKEYERTSTTVVNAYLLAADVWNDKITLAFAEHEHGVVLDPVTLKVDADATRQCRARLVDERHAGERGRGTR